MFQDNRNRKLEVIYIQRLYRKHLSHLRDFFSEITHTNYILQPNTNKFKLVRKQNFFYIFIFDLKETFKNYFFCMYRKLFWNFTEFESYLR